MKISIITVVFNAGKTIADTIESVNAQTHSNIEYIVVDGGSTDGTQEIIARNKSDISKFVTGPDNGIYDAMNKGLGLATGEIIGFLNSDDVYANRCVLGQVADTIARNDLDALFGDVEIITAKAASLDRSLRTYRGKRFRPERIAWGWMPAHPALFLHRRVYDHFGSFRTDYRIAGDFELVARIFYGGTLTYQYLPEVLVRMRSGGVSTGGWRNTLLLNQEVLRACRENGIRTNMLKILSKYPAKLMEFIHL